MPLSLCCGVSCGVKCVMCRVKPQGTAIHEVFNWHRTCLCFASTSPLYCCCRCYLVPGFVLLLLPLLVAIVCHGHCACCSSSVDCEGCFLLGVWAVCCCFQVPCQGPCAQDDSYSEPLLICGWLLGNCASCVPRSVVLYLSKDAFDSSAQAFLRGHSDFLFVWCSVLLHISCHML